MEESGSHYVGEKTEETTKGKVLENCLVPTCINVLGTLALTERQEEKIQISENNWVRRIYFKHATTYRNCYQKQRLRRQILKRHLPSYCLRRVCVQSSKFVRPNIFYTY